MRLAYEKEAYRGDPVPDGLDVLDTYGFISLRSIYAQLRKGEITRSQAERDKGKLCYVLDREKRGAASDRRLVEQSARMFKDIEGAANAYGRERTVENADRLYEAIYRVTPGIREENNNGKL